MAETPNAQGEALAQEVRALREELTRLNGHGFVRVYNSVPRFLAYNFAKGLVVGLGTVLGATMLLSVVAWSISQIEFLPIVGEWAAEIARQMEDAGAK
ncbi:MAG: DUF5665 domain-containing protein [Pseudomonadota bacterium]